MTLCARISGLCILGTLTVCGQTLTPREIFYGEGKAAAPPHKAVAKVAPKVKPSAGHSPAATPSEQATSTKTPEPGQPPPTGADSTPTYQTVGYVPLGLKYSIVKRQPDGEYAEVDPDETFVAGDRIRVRVETNDSGYLYVVNAQSSSGNWQVLYPSSDAGGMRGANKVEKGQTYLIPANSSFRFDQNAGTEKLFVILSRQPEQDLENLIYSLQETKHKSNSMSKPMVASNLTVEDDLVKKLRQSYSRDLLIEKVDEPKSAENKDAQNAQTTKNTAPKKVPGAPKNEKAYYVVNPGNSSDARVVADIPLRHQ